MSFGQAAAVVLPAMFAYTLYLTSMVHQMQVETVSNPVLDRLLAEVTTGSNFTLRRAPEAVQLEKRVDADPMLVSVGVLAAPAALQRYCPPMEAHGGM